MTTAAAACAALCAWLLVPPSAHRRLRRVVGTKATDPPQRTWLAPMSSLALGIAIALLLGSPTGVVAGVGIAIAGPRVIGRLESRAETERRRALQRQLPGAIDLLAAALASGAPVEVAVRVVAGAEAAPLADELGRVAGSLELGAPAAEAWRGADQSLDEVARACVRSAATGAPLAELLVGVARDLRMRRRTEVEVAVREAGVRAFAPLAACFLPAFVLLGGLPTVMSMAEGTGVTDLLAR